MNESKQDIYIEESDEIYMHKGKDQVGATCVYAWLKPRCITNTKTKTD